MGTAVGWSLGRPAEGTEGWAGRAISWLRSRVQGRNAPESPLRVVARVSLGPKKALVLVHCLGRQVLVAVSGDTVTPVMELPRARARKGSR